jgi:hypothetical protein
MMKLTTSIFLVTRRRGRPAIYHSAVDNLDGVTVFERTLRVDHFKSYRQPRTRGEDGEWKEAEEQRLNALPKLLGDRPVERAGIHIFIS